MRDQAAPPAARPNWRQRGYDATYERNRLRVIREETVCALCGEPVDKALSGRHRDGPTVDHVLPRAQGGTNSRANLRLAHLRCNSARPGQERPRRKRPPARHPGLIDP